MIEDPDYKPTDYTASSVWAQPSWAHPINLNDAQLSAVRAANFTCPIRQDGMVLNPQGRTGMTGRGLLGKYGANYAADAVVMCWDSETKMMMMIAIQRGDTGQWAIPGGMVDFKESALAAARRELKEEAGVELDVPGLMAYHGYVKDPRNTDLAWMETTCYAFELKSMNDATLRAGDDAVNTAWIPMDESDERFSKLFANHKEFAIRAKQVLMESYQHARA